MHLSFRAPSELEFQFFHRTFLLMFDDEFFGLGCWV